MSGHGRDPRILRREKPAIAIDFDGTLADYSEGYRGPGIYGELLPGALEALRTLAKDFEIIILTARGPEDHEGIRRHLKSRGVTVTEVTNVKRPAALYIDDRGLRFTDWADTLRRARELLQSGGIPRDAHLDTSPLDP